MSSWMMMIGVTTRTPTFGTIKNVRRDGSRWTEVLQGTVPVVLMQDIMPIYTHNLCKALRETYY